MLLTAESLQLKYSANAFRQILKSRYYMLNIGISINRTLKALKKSSKLLFRTEIFGFDPLRSLHLEYIIDYSNNN